MSKSLTEIFNFQNKNIKEAPLTDYDIFPDKKLLDELRKKIIEHLIDKEVPEGKDMEDFINENIDECLEGYDLSNIERSHIFNLIDDEINGLGPISELLTDNNITEIMVNGPKDVYVEIDGKLVKDNSVSFINDDHIIRTIQRLIGPLGRTIDSSNPMVDSRLADGSRINAVIPPLSVNGPVITIRKFKRNMTSIDDLLRVGTLTAEMATFLEAAVQGKLNIIVCGGTGSGKTTLLNILSSFIGNNERIITIEDAAELKLEQEHVISLETRTENYNNNSAITIRDLVINALRMRPDRIIVGECRGKEAFDMLQAMNTGHDGSLTTLHANGVVDALNRLETMVLMSGMDIPINAIREYIENAIDLVINIERMHDGKRKITNISEVVGFDNDMIKLNPIFEFVQKGLTDKGEENGEYIKTKKEPYVYKVLTSRGITKINNMFKK
ncbi:MAG: CpaF family protein [Bacilli bacterium]|nr:CpaF family protein [Bacilli bacterium]